MATADAAGPQDASGRVSPPRFRALSNIIQMPMDVGERLRRHMHQTSRTSPPATPTTPTTPETRSPLGSPKSPHFRFRSATHGGHDSPPQAAPSLGENHTDLNRSRSDDVVPYATTGPFESQKGQNALLAPFKCSGSLDDMVRSFEEALYRRTALEQQAWRQTHQPNESGPAEERVAFVATLQLAHSKSAPTLPSLPPDPASWERTLSQLDNELQALSEGIMESMGTRDGMCVQRAKYIDALLFHTHRQITGLPRSPRRTIPRPRVLPHESPTLGLRERLGRRLRATSLGSMSSGSLG